MPQFVSRKAIILFYHFITYGARPLKRVLQREILNKLSKMIIASEINKDKKTPETDYSGVIF